MRLRHENRTCACTCVDILIRFNHKNRHNHDVRPFRQLVLVQWLDLNAATVVSLPSTTNLKIWHAGTVNRRIVLQKKTDSSWKVTCGIRRLQYYFVVHDRANDHSNATVDASTHPPTHARHPTIVLTRPWSWSRPTRDETKNFGWDSGMSWEGQIRNHLIPI